MMTVADAIRSRLRDALAPEALDVKDESHLHKGHAGARPGGESHFRIRIVASRFEGMSRIARQRAVNAALADLLAGPVHALAMATLTPAEAAKSAAD